MRSGWGAHMLAFLNMIELETDKVKFETLYTNYKPLMLSVAYSILQDANEAESIVHDAFLKIMKHLDQIEDAQSTAARNYVATVVRNLSYNYVKRQRIVPMFSLEESPLEDADGVQFVEKIEREDLFHLIVELIRSLPYPYKDALYLRYVNEMEVSQIADTLGKSQNNVRQMLKRGKAKLNQLMKENGVTL